MNDPRQQSAQTAPPVTGTAPAGQQKTDFQKLLEKKEMTFVPFGAQDAVRLTVRNVQELIAVPTKSGKTCSERDALRFMMMCQAKRLNPFEGDAFLIGYDSKDGPVFSLITAHQAFLKRAEVHPEYNGMESGIVVLDENGSPFDRETDFHMPHETVVGGWARVHFKNRKFPTFRRVRRDRFDNGFAQWGKDAAGMICKCAEADSLRSSFPTMVGGLYLREELDFMPDAEPQTSRPLFESAMSKAKGKADVKPEGKPPEGDTTSAPEPGLEADPRAMLEKVAAGKVIEAAKAEASDGHHYNPLKALRNLMKIAKLKEGELLDFWAATGATDGSQGSLEEVAMADSKLVQSTAENWQEFSSKMIEQLKKGEQ